MATRSSSDRRAPLRGTRGQLFDLDGPATPKSKSRLPEIAMGVLLVTGFALASLWWQTSQTETTPVIALGVGVERGDVIDLDDLVLVEISTEDEINVLGKNDSGVVVGRVALSDMAAGTFITGDHVTGGSIVELGDGVVGLSLGPGEFPSLSMRAGDVVDVVLTPSASDTSALESDLAAIRDGTDTSGDQVIVRGASVVEVATIGNQGQLFLSLTMSDAEAAIVARAASQDRVRLVEVSEEAASS